MSFKKPLKGNIMASGRADYWRSTVISKILGSELVDSFLLRANTTINPYDRTNIYYYKLPVGYKYFVSGFKVTADVPYFNQVDVAIGLMSLMTFYVDSDLTINFGDSGAIEMDAGEEITITGVNNDEVDVIFTFVCWGWRELI